MISSKFVSKLSHHFSVSLDNQTKFKPKNVACSINPYEILEPIKVDNILVDLSTDTDKTHDSLQLGSFIDTVRKTEYDLVDLYQNIYVTPLHIQKTNGQDNATDFADFFDKLELDDKKDGPIENKSNALASEFRKPCNKPIEAINEVRNDIHKEKLKPFNHTLNNEYKPKLECHFNKSKPAVNEIKFNKDVLTKNNDKEFMEHNKIKEILRVFNADKSMNMKQDNTKGIKKLHVIDMINDKQFNGSIKNGLLQTMKKDEKLYAKRNILLDRNLTKGADIYEKSIVLPQMMERLAARKKILDEQKNLKRRLILGGPICSNKKENNTCFEPVLLMKDCNEERLKSLATRLLFADFVKNGKTEE
ncbi:unnamed protein product [Colias eurytheme]|nr:unnamed protein product [Colias eurytheme]